MRQLTRKDTDSCDLEKSLYMALEKVSELSCDEDSDYSLENHYGLVILGSSGGRFDYTINTFSMAYKYHNRFQKVGKTDIYMMSKSSCSFYLKVDATNVITCTDRENTEEGYSITSLTGEASACICEYDAENNRTDHSKYRG